MLENLPDDIIDTSAVALERIANAQAYMNAVLNISEPQEADTESTFADIEGDALDELQWQCNDIEWTLNATIHCDSNFLYPILTKESTNLEHRVSGIYYYHPDHLGSATWITNSARVPVEFIHYMPFGELWYNQQASAYNERFKFTGKERDEETGYDYFGARYYSSALPMWMSVDPLAGDYPWISPYAYCAWNPIKYIDPTGMWIEVSPNEDGTYLVVNGDLNRDKNIYILKNGERSGEILGKMYSQYSFFDEDGNVVKSVIDPNNQSGNNFLNDVYQNTPSIDEYIKPIEDYSINKSGRNYGRYDFKSNGKTKTELEKMHSDKRDEYYYRGMPITIGGKTTYGTARDIGNYAAGYIAGRKGLGIVPTLFGFDVYQGSIEPPVSRIPQLRGHSVGIIDHLKNLIY